MKSWEEWQSEVLTHLPQDFSVAFVGMSLDDIDWPARRVFYVQGRAPKAAIDRALERDL